MENDMSEMFFTFSYVHLKPKNVIITFGSTRSDEIFIYDLNKHIWYELELTLNEKLIQASAIELNDEIHVIGGYNSSEKKNLDTFYRFNTSNLQK